MEINLWSFFASLIFFINLNALFSYAFSQFGIKSNKYELFICTCVALVHGVLCLLFNSYMLMIFTFDEIESYVLYDHMTKLFTTAYFVYDLYHMYKLNDVTILFHHIMGIILLLSGFNFYTTQYSYYETILLIIGESTNPLQNSFFVAKTLYGDEENKQHEFNTKYYNFFKFFIVFFAVMRFIFAPIVIYSYLQIIEHTLHYYVILTCFLFLISGSLMWSINQNKKLIKMKANN